jgi:hypothetical protein
MPPVVGEGLIDDAVDGWEIAGRSDPGDLNPSGAGPGSNGPVRSICMCQKWRTGRRPRAVSIAAAASSPAWIAWRKRPDGSPASNWSARSSVRLRSEEPMPRPRCPGRTMPQHSTTPGSSRMACTYPAIVPAPSTTTQASVARSKPTRLHSSRTKSVPSTACPASSSSVAVSASATASRSPGAGARSRYPVGRLMPGAYNWCVAPIRGPVPTDGGPPAAVSTRPAATGAVFAGSDQEGRKRCSPWGMWPSWAMLPLNTPLM